MSSLPSSLAEYAEGLRKTWGISGISVSLINGRSQGFGSPSSGVVTPDTVFSIASNTKLFTAVAIGILVDEGKLSFESKIKDVLPGFKVANRYNTEHVTIAHALSHTTGCASGNIFFAFRFDDAPRDMLENICTTRSSKELNQACSYDNRWFSVMACIIEQSSGLSYSSFVKSRILQPLGMLGSTYDANEAEAHMAIPTITLDDRHTTTELPYWLSHARPGNAFEGPGGLFSSSSDMARWLAYLSRTIKGENVDDDPKLISRAALSEIIRARVVSDMQLCFGGRKTGEAGHPAFSTPLYGLGIERFHIHGIDVVSHHGYVMGFGSVTLWTPARDFGIVVLANEEQRGNMVAELIALRAFEDHFHLPHTDWEGALVKKEQVWSSQPFDLSKFRDSQVPAFDIADIRGTFEADGYTSLHIVGASDTQGLSRQLIERRNTYLNSPVFGNLVDDITLIAFWNTTQTYLGSFFSLHHIRGNVFLGELVTYFPAHSDKQAVCVPCSATWSPYKALFYAFKDEQGNVSIECRSLPGKEVPLNTGLGEGDFTLKKVSGFDAQASD